MYDITNHQTYIIITFENQIKRLSIQKMHYFYRPFRTIKEINSLMYHGLYFQMQHQSLYHTDFKLW